MNLINVGEYSTRAQRLLYDFILANPGCEQLTIETTSPYKTAKDLLAHCVGSEGRWQSRVVNEPLPNPIYEQITPESVTSIYADWDTQRQRTLSIIQGATTEMLTRQIPYTLGQFSYNGVITASEMLFHIFNHEHYHRGQCSMMLQMQGFDPPQFDYPLTVGQVE